jgi:hypothetical protein
MDSHSIVHVLALVALYLALIVGLIAIPLGLGGNFILLTAALVVAIATHFQAVPWWALLTMGGLVVLGEILEAVLGSVAARRYGASRWGMLGAFVGGIVGVIPGTALLPIIGTVIGSFVGAAAGAILFEWIHRRNLRESAPAGWGAFLGKLGASLLKLTIGLAMAVYVIVRTWPF